MSKPATHSVNLSALVSDPEQWNDIYKEFTGVAREWGERVEYISVSSSELGEEVEVVEEDELYHDENTLNKTREAIIEAGFSKPQAYLIIEALHNAGILFRERR